MSGKLRKEVNAKLYKSNNEVLLFCNARSIRNTWPVFKAAASVYKPSTLAVVETWLSDDISNHYIYHDYHLHAVSRNARVSDPAGGGVALFFQPELHFNCKTSISQTAAIM